VKNFLVFILLFFVGQSVLSQRISFGFNGAFTAFQRTTLPDNFIFPEHSYFIYYTANEKDDLPVHDQKFSGYSVGLNLNVDYKRFIFISEFTLGTNTIKIPVLFPSPISESVDGDSWSTFKITKNYFNLPLLISYKLNRKANGPFLIGGMQYSFCSFSEADFLDTELTSGISIFLSDTEMYNVLYNEWNYGSMILGAGLKKDNSFYSVRFSQRIGKDLSKYPLARYFQIDLQYSKTLNFQRLKKGYHIYLD